MGTVGSDTGIPRTHSSPAINMRAPFLSPASRPTSSLWSPPSYPYPLPPTGTNSSFTTFPRKAKPPMPSSRLSHKLSKEEKPWLKQRDCRDRASWWLTFVAMFLGIGGAAVLCFFGYSNVLLLKDSDLCMVLDESFDQLDLQNTWSRDVELGGFGNGEFQMTTDSSDNLFVQDGQLYIMPTFTSDKIGRDAILDGGSYDLGNACTTSNKVRRRRRWHALLRASDMTAACSDGNAHFRLRAQSSRATGTARRSSRCSLRGSVR